MPLQTSDLASCEPSRSMRDRIDQDLHIIGEISCPQKVDMRAIIPVYPFNPPERNYQQQAYQQIAIGVPFFGDIMSAALIPLPHQQVNYLTLQSLLVQIAIDAAGRAAMALATDGIVIYLSTLAGNIFVGEWDIVALPLTGGEYWFGSHMRNWNAANTLRPRMDMELQYPYPIKIASQLWGANNYLWLTVVTRLGGPFPANSGLSFYSIFDYTLK